MVKCGGNGGIEHEIIVPEGHKIVGFYGKSGRNLDKIGFIFYKI